MIRVRASPPTVRRAPYTIRVCCNLGAIAVSVAHGANVLAFSSMSRRLVVRRAAQVVAGLVVGAVIAEGAFWLRDRGAFPHVNFYVPDARLGVRLRPGATERISFGGNPVTRVRINRDGTRGGELPPPGGDEILVVGDSQAFGLGVEEDEAFAARLGRLTGRPVVNGGVPTYGPDEYDAMVEEMLARRRPKTVVYVVNMANDLFEANRPNRDRHAVWDGWAVRKESAAAAPPPRWFPGRDFLYGRSHLVFALRKAWHERRVSPEHFDDAKPGAERGFASEGTWTDLVGAGKGAGRARAEARAALHDEIRKQETERSAAAKAAIDIEYKIESQVNLEEIGLQPSDELREVGYQQTWLQSARSTVGDIVQVDEGESSRGVPVTAEMIKMGADFRRDLEKALKRAKGPDKRAQVADALGLLADWDAEAGKLRRLDAAPARILRHSSPLLAHVERVKAMCATVGARLVLLVLPLDVMVSDKEWAKYDAKAQDMSAAAVLIDDLTRASEEIGVSALDATAALAAAEPGAFLNRDIHMTPKGHDAVARALATKLAEPAPSFPTGALPVGRTRLREASFDRTGIRGGDKAGCTATDSGEWLRIYCYVGRKSGVQPRGIKLIEGGHGEVMTFTMPRGMLFVAPQLGDRLIADFVWSDRVQRFESSKEKRGFGSGRPPGDGDPQGPTPLDTKLLACLKETKQMDEAGYKLMVGAEPDCERTYGDDCERLVECAKGDPASPPDCPRGSVNAGVLGRCHALCGPGRPACAHGACVDWSGAQICE